MADIATSILEVGSNRLILQDAEARTKINEVYVTDTASGSIASFPDGADGVPVKSLKVAIKPVQDLHGQDAAYPAGGGKNKYKMRSTSTTVNGITVTANVDGTNSIRGTATANAQITMCDNADILTSIIAEGGTFTMSLNKGTYNANTLNVSISYKETASGPIKYIVPNNPVTIPQGSIFNNSNLWVQNGSTVQTLDHFRIQFEKGSATPYAPYENICPISGHSTANVTRLGKNTYKMRTTAQTMNGVTVTPNSDGTLAISGTATGGSVNIPLCGNSGELTNLFGKGGTFSISFSEGTYNDETLNASISYIDPNGRTRYITPENEYYTIPQGSRFNNSTLWVSHGDTVQTLNHFAIQFEEGSKASSFVPYYQCQTVTIDLGGTIYGGTLDVTTGVLTVDRGYVEYDGSSDETWELYGSGSASAYSMKIIHENVFFNANAPTIQTNYLTPTVSSARWADFDAFISTQSGNVFVAGIRTITTVDAWKTYIAQNPLQVVYDFATPQTIQLTEQEVRTLLGTNNIWSDAGAVDVIYRADTKLYIEKLTAPTEDDMIADHAISANSFFMVGNTLYRATTAIASGATITVGTNATKLSLSDALNALA